MGFVEFIHIPSKENISDCLTKLLGPKMYSQLVKPYFVHHSPKQGECQEVVSEESNGNLEGVLSSDEHPSSECSSSSGPKQE